MTVRLDAYRASRRAQTSASVLYGLYDVLLSVGAVYPDMTVVTPGDALLDVFIVAATAELFRCFGNVLVEPAASVDETDEVDVVVICDMYAPITDAPIGKYPVETAWLRRVHARGTLIATVCTGSVLLAESGLLDGRSCACHWAYGPLFRRGLPAGPLPPEQVLELAHEADGIITGGGVTSWQDLVLHLIARYCSPAHAAATAKVFLLDRHAEGQLPYSAMTRVVRGDDAAVGRALDVDRRATSRWPTRSPRWPRRPGSCRGRSRDASWRRRGASRSTTCTSCASRPHATSSRRVRPGSTTWGSRSATRTRRSSGACSDGRRG